MISSALLREYGQRKPLLTREERCAQPVSWGRRCGIRQCPAFVDVDNDGDMDLVIGRSEGDLKFYYENTGRRNPSYTRRQGALNPFHGRRVGSRSVPAFVDVDNDGDMDLVIGRNDGDLKFYYENTGSAATLLTREERWAQPV